ncbi:MAG: acetate--CoA ligase family protein [Armatimonadota bacterium]|nr:acetate--CoA ligase family protein [Armatimonadota bacterium]MDR7439450.1 acetate--CoA ligase family protein [Armatimonadota bacterium]MDR7562907.1 acetate--CoA ligase family protein [Armatimonadota bacterium]MDR7568401.1 acetate--CoA ligase family protein [Armatimonadota bacterium]MDR7601455.1 acetate--CoA ligase family protein [Armatimonadota bacterium]
MPHPVIAQALEQGRGFLLEPESYALCEAYGIPHAPFAVCRTAEEAVAAADRVGYPVVLKVVSPHILHKSEVDGVVVGLRSGEEVREAYPQLLEAVSRRAPQASVDGVLVQRMEKGGVELVVGGVVDPQFGPVVMVGGGGILVELLRDVSFRLAPIDLEEALRQLSETRAYRLLQGLRGRPPADIRAVGEVLVQVGRLLVAEPAIRELDLNPVVAGPGGCVAVDARIVLQTDGSPVGHP